MRIAQVAPLYESVPPKLYGGTERVVSYLTEELVRQGHQVTLFASGDSVSQARLVAALSAVAAPGQALYRSAGASYGAARARLPAGEMPLISCIFTSTIALSAVGTPEHTRQ